jgi:hypothetical protein
MARKTYGPEQIIGMLREADVALGQGRSVGDSIGNCVVVLEQKQGSQFILILFLDPDLHVMGQHESQKDLLLAVEARADLHFSVFGPLLASQRGQRVGYVGQDIEEVTFLGVDYPLHFGHLLFSEPLVGQTL